MKLKTIAKLLILLFVFFFVASIIRACVSVPRVPRQTILPAPEQPVAIPQTQTAPVAQQPAAVQPALIQPLIEKPEKVKFVKGSTKLYAYNLNTCDYTDVLPAESVFSTQWNETDVKSLDLRQMSKMTTWSRCVLLNFKFYIHAGTEGIYTFSLIRDDHSKGSIRVNGVTAAYDGPGQVRLLTGWYEIDFRLFMEPRPFGDHIHAYTILMKAPGENEMHAVSKDEIYTAEEVKDAAPAAPAQTE